MRRVSLPDAGGLNGITFDTVGRFGHRLLITGGLPGDHTAVVAIDCHGSATTLTRTGPRLEGGVQVAPASFPGYGGDLIAPDELSGRVVAVDPSGDSAVVAESQVPAGGDTGVEGVAFVPPGFLSGGHAYTADRGTPGSPHPGTDTLLRLPAPSFASAGAHEGDMLLVTEASDLIVDIHCDHGCTARTLGMGAEPAHGEGHLHLLLVADHPRPAATPAPTVAGGGGHAATVLTVIAAVLAGGAAVLLAATVGRRRRARSRS